MINPGRKKNVMNIKETSTLDRRQSKMIMLLANVDQESLETVFDCNLLPNWRLMAIENTVSSDLFE